MNPQIIPFWQSILQLGKTVFPYVGLFLVIVFAILLLVLVLYLLYRLARRLPIFLRHLSWRCVIGFRRLVGWLRRGRSASQPIVMARFHASSKPATPLQLSFAPEKRVWPWATAPVGRPQDALFLVLGFDGSGQSALLAISGKVDSSPIDQPDPACELTWWRLENGWALEVNQTLFSAHDTPKFKHMLRILEQMCPACPVDGLIVAITAQQLLRDGKDGRAVPTLAGAAARIAGQLGAALPVQLMISHANTLRGFDELLQLRSSTGQRQATLGLRLPAATPAMPRPATAELLREAVMGQVLLALSMQPASSTNFLLRQALELPTEIGGLREPLKQFESQLSADSSATNLPWLQSIALTGFAPSADSGNTSELVFAGPALRQQVFLKSIVLPPGAGYPVQRHWQTKRAATLAYVVLASCAVVLFWSSVTWKRMDQNTETVERLLQGIGPELHLAKNSDISFASTLGTGSLEKLLQTVVALDQSTLTYVLVPSSWFSELHSDALKNVGELISRTLIRARSEELSTDFPQISEAMLTASVGVSAQRIDELPAYQELLTFLDSRELVAVSMDSAQRLNKQITYAQFLRFLGSKPDQLKLPKMNWSEAMPAEVTQRFKVASLKSPEIETALRQTIDSYWERLLREALDQHPLVLLSDDVQAGLLSASSGVFATPEAQQLDTSLKNLRREAELPSARRIFGNKTEALAFFAPAQLRLGLSSVVPSGQLVDMVALLEKRIESQRSTLLKKETDGIGLLFVPDAREGALQLGPEVKRFGNAFAIYMTQPFMSPAGKTMLVTAGGGQYLEWTLSALEPARNLSESLRDYSAGAAQTLDARIKGGLMRLARSNYLRQIDTLFSNATHLREEAPIRMQGDADYSSNAGSANFRRLSLRVTNLAAAGKLYRQLQPTDNAANPLSEVSEQLNRESNRLLEQLETELYRDDPYSPLIAGVASWVRNSPNEKMLASSFKGNAKERLVSSREYVRLQYAAPAAPLLEHLTAEASKVAPSDIVQRWSRLRETIDGYEKGSVTNGIYELERYVLALAKLRGANECVGFLDERQLPAQRSDYFSQQLVHLDEAVTNACEQRITQGQRLNYESFANWFNSAIAGRPPFSSSGWNGSNAALAVPLFERVLSRYSEFRQPLLIDTKSRENWPVDVGVFIARMDQLAAYFQAPQSANKAVPKMPVGAAKPPVRTAEVRSDMSFRARLEFRTGRLQEAGADQIMEWSINSGGRRYSSRGNDLFQWKIGEPIEVQLRWAANSPVSPLALASKSYNYSVGERSASFKYSGDWALFELLEKHKSVAVDADGGVALMFPVPTLGPKGRQDAKVFVSLFPPDAGVALVPDFPALAPLFPRNTNN